MYLDGIFDLWDRLKSKLSRQTPLPASRVLEYRGMTGYFSPEMIQEFEKVNFDYEQAFREAVDEVIAEDAEEDEFNEDNPYK